MLPCVLDVLGHVASETCSGLEQKWLEAADRLSETTLARDRKKLGRSLRRSTPGSCLGLCKKQQARKLCGSQLGKSIQHQAKAQTLQRGVRRTCSLFWNVWNSVRSPRAKRRTRRRGKKALQTKDAGRSSGKRCSGSGA